jgi:polar amino acid transport system substrate-binding protein
MSKRTPRLALLIAALIIIGWLAANPSLFVPGQAQPPLRLDELAVAPGRPALATQDDLLAEVLAAGKLVVATDANYPPWSFVNDEGVLDGFDVDVAKQVAARLGVGLEFVTPAWDEVTAGDWGGLWDVSIGSMTPTDERAQVLWFTAPYYYIPGSFAVHKDNTSFQDVGDLVDKVVGVGAATTYEAYLLGVLDLGDYGGYISYPPPLWAVVQAYNMDQEAIQDLALGDGVRLDAVMSAQPTIQSAIDEGVPIKVLGTPAFGEPIVFALDQARGPSDLMIAELNGIIADMHADHTLSIFSLKWLGIDVTEPGEPWHPPFSALLPLVAR